MHVRRIADRELTFIVSGKLWRNSLVMMDRETGSLWSHLTGECLEGELTGSRLEQIATVQTTWKDWSDAHPATRALKKDAEIHGSRYQKYFDDPDRIGILPMTFLSDTMTGKTIVHGVLVNGQALAVVDTALTSPIEVECGGTALKIFRGKDGGVRARRVADESELAVRLAYWFAWSSYFPHTRVWPNTE